jgi:MOSC domain-containing protein YiiM
VRKLNVDGDGQGDLAGHGGEQRAVSSTRLDPGIGTRAWTQRLRPWQFGENLTVEGLSDDDVCIGDRYQVGTPSEHAAPRHLTAWASA